MDNNSNAAAAAFSALQTRLQSDAPTEHAATATATRRDVHCASSFCCSRHRAPSQPHPAAHTPALRRLCSALLLLALVAGGHGCGPGRGIGGPRRNRRLTPLVFKQHVPNMSERNLGASALHEGAIRRDSPKFKDLVPNYNRDIIFKDEEGTGADRLMTQRCKEKLNTLAVSVMNQWPGVRLRVTESWDEDNLHGAESLHYEGRAVDITTSDRDRTKYGMLARLAVEAGFDWVYYESRAHIHCSVKSDSSHISHVSGCFSSNSTVLTSSGERKTMAALEVGDQVLSIGDNGEPQFSEVILFMDRQLQLLQDFVEVQAEGGARLLLTPAHLMMLWNPADQRTEYRFADQVRVGDFVFVSLGREPEQRFLQRVVKLRSVRGRGVVAPLTRTGTIVVDSVAASCYAVVNSHRLAHWGLLPMRMMASLQTWLPTPKRVRVPRSTKIQNGVHWYTRTLNALKNYVLPNSWRYH